MATTIEFVLSRNFTLGVQSRRERVYRVFGTNDETEVESEILAAAPLTYGGLVRESLTVAPIDSDEVWEGTVSYVSEEDDPEYTFDTGGGTQRVTEALSNINNYALSGTPPNFFGAIGVNNDSVEGVDIVVPVFNFSETHFFEDSEVNTTYKQALFRLTGRVNNAAFRDFNALEVLLLGVSGQRRAGDHRWPLTFRFAASPNVTGLTLGGIGPIAKAGWDYLWVRHTDTADMSAFTLIRRPTSVHVDRVYYTDNFADLNIG